MVDSEIESRLERAEAASYGGEEEAMAHLTSLTISINREIEAAGSDAFVSGIGDKLRG